MACLLTMITPLGGHEFHWAKRDAIGQDELLAVALDVAALALCHLMVTPGQLRGVIPCVPSVLSTLYTA
jgi:hypothetical protein